VSTRSSADLALSGIAKRANELVVDLRPARRNDHPPAALLEGVARQRLDTQPGAVGGHLYLTRSQSDMVAQRFWDYQPTCLVNGCPYACTIPSRSERPSATLTLATELGLLLFENGNYRSSAVSAAVIMPSMRSGQCSSKYRNGDLECFRMDAARYHESASGRPP
jgi:hypothetical protein